MLNEQTQFKFKSTRLILNIVALRENVTLVLLILGILDFAIFSRPTLGETVVFKLDNIYIHKKDTIKWVS